MLDSENTSGNEVTKSDDSNKLSRYLANLSNAKNTDTCVDIAVSFLNQAGKALKGSKSNFGRDKPLLAMPIPGVINLDKNGPDLSILKEIIPQVYTATLEWNVDIALCLVDKKVFRLVQSQRESLCPFTQGPHWMLSDHLKQEALRLAEMAKINRLSIFFGAGVSFASGLPSWGGLLDILAEKTTFTEEQREKLSKLGFLDQPTILEEELGDSFKQIVADAVSEGRYTPAHAMMHSFEVPSVTTNYDCLYEDAANSCGDPVPRLPWDANEIKKGIETPAVLKLHGSVSHPESIVLSRRDYMRYADEKQALRGRVQGLLMTSDLVFIGFSMTDDNVHKIIDQCRKVLYENGEPQGKMGTILTMTENEMFDRLWDQDFHINSFAKSWSEYPAWFHDSFLDHLSFVIANQNDINKDRGAI